MVTTLEQAERITLARVKAGKCYTGDKFIANRVPKAVRRYLKRIGVNVYDFADDIGILQV